jgi:broad specificity phosphatase PhoE
MAKARDFSLLLFRSAPTVWDMDERLSGASDHPVCAEGRRLLDEAIDHLAGADLDVVLSAPDESSVQTAELLAAAAEVKVRRVRGLEEVNLGLWEGLRLEDIAEKYPSAHKQWVNNPSSVRVPGGESLAAAEQRILEALASGLERTRAGRTRVGVVVRPMAWGLIRCWLSETPIDRLWGVLRDAPMFGWYEVERDRLESAHGTVSAQP